MGGVIFEISDVSGEDSGEEPLNVKSGSYSSE
jgi:hypothetical protein